VFLRLNNYSVVECTKVKFILEKIYVSFSIDRSVNISGNATDSQVLRDMRSSSFENWRENAIAEVEDIFPRYRFIANDLERFARFT